MHHMTVGSNAARHMKKRAADAGSSGAADRSNITSPADDKCDNEHADDLRATASLTHLTSHVLSSQVAGNAASLNP